MTSNEQQSPIANPTPLQLLLLLPWCVCVCVCVHSYPQESQHVCGTRVSSFAPFLDLSPFLEQSADILVTCAPQADSLCADVRGHLLAFDAAKPCYAAAFECVKQLHISICAQAQHKCKQQWRNKDNSPPHVSICASSPRTCPHPSHLPRAPSTHHAR